MDVFVQFVHFFYFFYHDFGVCDPSLMLNI